MCGPGNNQLIFQDNRRAYRQLLFTLAKESKIGDYLGGCILYEETLYQSTPDGVPFVKLLKDLGIVPGKQLIRSSDHFTNLKYVINNPFPGIIFKI